MSIYDDQFNEDAKPPVGGKPPLPEPVVHAEQVDDRTDDDPPRRRGCGCGSCLLAMFLLGLIGIAICGAGGYLTYRNAPEWAHDAVIAAVNDSDLDAESKREISEQMDRLLREYRAGNISGEQVSKALEEFGDSPLSVLIMAYAAMENYVEPSGLSDEEQAAAKLAFQRVARGTFERDIDPDDLEEALDYISTKDFNGNRQMKSAVPDDDLRALIEECQRVADEADVPNEPYEVDVAAEVKRIVDRALGVVPEEELEGKEADAKPPMDAGGSPAEPAPRQRPGTTTAMETSDRSRNNFPKFPRPLWERAG